MARSRIKSGRIKGGTFSQCSWKSGIPLNLWALTFRCFCKRGNLWLARANFAANVDVLSCWLTIRYPYAFGAWQKQTSETFSSSGFVRAKSSRSRKTNHVPLKHHDCRKDSDTNHRIPTLKGDFSIFQPKWCVLHSFAIRVSARADQKPTFSLPIYEIIMSLMTLDAI